MTRRKKATRRPGRNARRARNGSGARHGKASRRNTRPRAADSPAVVVVDLGRAVTLEYERDGAIHRHTFTGKAARVYATRDGSQLVVSPVRVKGRSVHG